MSKYRLGFNAEIHKKKAQNLHLVNWESVESAVFHKQYLIIAGFMIFVLLIYMFRLWYLQVLEGAEYRYQSENNRIRIEDIAAPRGIIYDHNGVPLVENRPAFELLLVREDVRNLKQTIDELARLCRTDPKDFYKILDANKSVPKFKPIRLLDDMNRDCLARVEAQLIRLPGVRVQVEPKREYLWDGMAAHLIGYLSEITESELKSPKYENYLAGEDVGRIGVEKAFEKYLHGKRGVRQVEVDAVGRRVRLLDQKLPIPGRNIWLTIDLDVQKTAEDCLRGTTTEQTAMREGQRRGLPATGSQSTANEYAKRFIPQWATGRAQQKWLLSQQTGPLFGSHPQ